MTSTPVKPWEKIGGGARSAASSVSPFDANRVEGKAGMESEFLGEDEAGAGALVPASSSGMNRGVMGSGYGSSMYGSGYGGGGYGGSMYGGECTIFFSHVNAGELLYSPRSFQA